MSHMNYDAADLRAIKGSNFPEMLMDIRQNRFDSADDAALFFARELDHVKAKTYDKQYPELNALTFLPQETEGDPGAETITYYTYEKTGMAKIINDYAHDFPAADVIGQPHTAVVKGLGSSYNYSVQEMRASRFAGKSLDSRKAENARYAIERTMNQIAWNGDAANGLLGVLSVGQQIPVMSIIPGNQSKSWYWKNKTADDVLDDVRRMISQVSRLTKDVERPDTLLLPTDVYYDIQTKRIPDGTVTILEFLKNATGLTIERAAELNADSTMTNPYAAPTNDPKGKGVALLYTKSAEKLAIQITSQFMQHPAQIEGMTTKVICDARTAGVIVYYPMSALILTGVSSN